MTTTSATSGEGNSYPSRAHEFTLVFFSCLSWVRVVHVVKLHVITCLVPCSALISAQKRSLFCLYSHVLQGFICYLCYLYLCVYWCPTRFSYQMMFVSFNTNRTGVTNEAETADPSGSIWVHFLFCGVAQSLVFSVVFYRSSFVRFS